MQLCRGKFRLRKSKWSHSNTLKIKEALNPLTRKEACSPQVGREIMVAWEREWNTTLIRDIF